MLTAGFSVTSVRRFPRLRQEAARKGRKKRKKRMPDKNAVSKRITHFHPSAPCRLPMPTSRKSVRNVIFRAKIRSTTHPSPRLSELRTMAFRITRPAFPHHNQRHIAMQETTFRSGAPPKEPAVNPGSKSLEMLKQPHEIRKQGHATARISKCFQPKYARFSKCFRSKSARFSKCKDVHGYV